MTIIKSLSVGEGDMFYIKHMSDNFSIIDCCLSDDNSDDIIKEIKKEKSGKAITRFISTHPDNDHIQGLEDLDKAIEIINFYCVSNETTKADETDDFNHYCELRDSDKAFYLSEGCSRRWMNQTNDERGSAGLTIKWPDTENADFKDALKVAKDGGSPNNISPIIQYSGSAKFLWMGDLETEFIENIESDLDINKIDVLFAPHHGRESGKVPSSLLEKISPKLIVIGEAPSKNLNYYNNYNTITQNSSGDITFEIDDDYIHIYVSNDSYKVTYLKNLSKSNKYGKYIGSLAI